VTGIKLWIFTPVYHDVDSFVILRERLGEVLAESDLRNRPVEFVVLDDTGGMDSKVARLRDLGNVTVLEPPFNLGHQRAIVYALRKMLPRIADEDAIVTLDADGEDQPSDLPRLLAPLLGPAGLEQKVSLALRTKRQEPLPFKLGYRIFRVLFRALTGATVRSGNFAAMPGALARRVIMHPVFDLSYSSAILSLSLPTEFVPCERGSRYKGRSKMTYGKLALHGLRMMMPFTDRIAIRALALFVASLVFGLVLAFVVVLIKIFGSGVPGWATFTVLGALIVSLVALGNFVTLFVIFSQNRAVSLANIESIEVGRVDATTTCETPPPNL
jgi:polyisoprenyl-phosphate glycosyltransferase